MVNEDSPKLHATIDVKNARRPQQRAYL